MRLLSQSVDAFLERILAKRYSSAFAKIFTNWPTIVGQNLASICVPIMIDKFDRTLIVEILDKSKAVELYFMQEVILLRLAAVLQQNYLDQKITKLVIRVASN